MKKTTYALIPLLLLLSISSYTSAYFTDFDQNSQFSEAIIYAEENKIVNGYPDGTFKEKNEINRAEFTKIILNFTLGEEEIYGSNCFPDIKEEWYAKYVCTAKRKGIINGYGDGNFKPGETISFAEAAKIVSLGFNHEIKQDPETWYKPFVQNLSDRNVIPFSITSISKKINRGEMVEIVYRLDQKSSNETFSKYINDQLVITGAFGNWYKPKPKSSWQWQLTGDINTSYDVEMYDLDLVETPQSVIDKLHSDGKKVICYFSAGSWEEFRDDADKFPAEVLGEKLEGWEDEKWLDVKNYQKFAHIMEARMDLAVSKGCDGIEPDNVDGYLNNNGFNLTYDDQLAYNKWLANSAHSRNLSVGLKNGLDQVEDLVDHFDFEINEQCFEYNECDKLLPFIEKNKAVFGVEYELESDEFCQEANEMQFSWLKMNYDLDGSRSSC